MSKASFLLSALLFLGLPLSAVHAHEGEAHGDHNSHHDGAVLMYKNIHYEVELPTSGGVRVWITDAMRVELPAATVSDLAVEIERPSAKVEPVDMAISMSGEYWEGSSAPVTDVKSVVRVAFLLNGDPVLVNIPGTMWPSLLNKKPVDGKTHAHGH